MTLKFNANITHRNYCGQSILHIVASKTKINSDKIQIIPRDTKSNPEETFKISKELYEEGVRIILGPVFNKNLIFLSEINDFCANSYIATIIISAISFLEKEPSLYSKSAIISTSLSPSISAIYA